MICTTLICKIFCQKCIGVPEHKQNSLVPLQLQGGFGPLRHPTSPAPLSEGPPASPWFTLAPAPSQSQAPQGSQDRTHRRQRRQGQYERRFLKSVWKEVLKIKCHPSVDCCNQTTRFCHRVCRRHLSWCLSCSYQQGWTEADHGYLCDRCPHSWLSRQGMIAYPGWTISEDVREKSGLMV